MTKSNPYKDYYGEARYNYFISQMRQVTRTLSKDSQIILLHIAQDIVQKLKANIKVYWYDNYHSKSKYPYDRTYDFLNSIKYDNDNLKNGRITVYFDSSMWTLIPFSERNHSMPAHMGLTDEPVEPEVLISIIEDGDYPSKYNPRSGYGSHAIERTVEWMQTQIDDRITDFIQKESIKWNIKRN